VQLNDHYIDGDDYFFDTPAQNKNTVDNFNGTKLTDHDLDAQKQCRKLTNAKRTKRKQRMTEQREQ
jgi:hypothetical protein